MSDLQNAATIRPCIVRSTADATGVKGLLFRNALSGAPASTTLTLPTEVRGAYVDIIARGVAVQYGFVLDGDTSPTLVFDQPVTIGTGHAAAAGTIMSGERVSVEIPRDAKQLVYIWESATAGAYFEGHLSGRKG
jgi:hypothetical protein